MTLALWIAGNPFNQRLERLDKQRISDLRSLQGAIGRFHKKEKRLPDTLDELKTYPDSYVERTTDAVTKRPYVYKRLGNTSYRLGAVFDLPRPKMTVGGFVERTAFISMKLAYRLLISM